MGDGVVVSGCTSLDHSGKPRAAGDWATQYDLCHDTIQGVLEEVGAQLDDVIVKRTFTVESAEQNRPYGEGPGWFSQSCPASMGCRISGLALPELVVEVETMALKGAHANIEWLGPFETDPLG